MLNNFHADYHETLLAKRTPVTCESCDGDLKTKLLIQTHRATASVPTVEIITLTLHRELHNVQRV